jgi:hypothetical protein
LQVLEKTILAPVAQLLPVAKDLGDGMTNPVLSPVHENLHEPERPRLLPVAGGLSSTGYTQQAVIPVAYCFNGLQYLAVILDSSTSKFCWSFIFSSSWQPPASPGQCRDIMTVTATA